MGSEGLVERWDELTGPKPFTCVTAPAYFLVTASDGLARFSCNQQALSEGLRAARIRSISRPCCLVVGPIRQLHAAAACSTCGRQRVKRGEA